MKNLTLYFIFISLFISCKNSEERKLKLTEKMIVAGENLIPSTPGATPSYWCTWGAQNYAVDSATIANSTFGIGGHSVIARNLTEARVFGKEGWAASYKKIQKDLYLMFDVGWDIPADMNFDDSRWKLGSQNVATDKFPSCTGTPVEKLKKLNELTKAAGWKGAGLWIPAHAWQEGKGGKMFSWKELESFFREKAKWANEAGIEYWKMDYGSRFGDLEFRKLVTKIAKEEAPKLWVEHCIGGGPLNDVECPWDCEATGSGEFIRWCNGGKLKFAVDQLEFAQVLRTYDVTAYLSVPTTLDRVAQILNSCAGKNQISGILNCEDEPYIAATLGCMMGIMRHPAFLSQKSYAYDPLELRKRIDEVIRAVRWQRIAPAFGAGLTPMFIDSVRLTDTWAVKKGESWTTWLYGQTIKQSAPARVSRNMPLPVVKCEGDAPYVIASKHISGAISVATLMRHDTIKGFYFPLADVTVSVENYRFPIAAFGRYKSLTLNFQKLPAKFKILAQDLAGDIVYDITEMVEKKGNNLTFCGNLIKTVGLSAATDTDISEAGIVIKIIEN